MHDSRGRFVVIAAGMIVLTACAGTASAAEETVEHRMQYEEQHYKVETAPKTVEQKVEQKTTVQHESARVETEPARVQKKTTVETVPGRTIEEKTVETHEEIDD